MPDLVKLLEQWAVVTAAPIPFAIAVVVAAGLIWLAVGWSYSSVLSGKSAQIELQDRQLADYREKLKGATPEEAKAKIDALEQTVNLTIGRRWEALTKTEIVALAANLSTVPKIRVQIMYENVLGRDLAQSFYDAFKQAGWDDATLGPGGGLGYGVTTGQGPISAVALKDAIEKSSKVKVEAQRTNQAEWPGLIFLAVGINAPSPF
jgi:hypothetical protein